jgi:hypothetical protein
VLLAGLNGVMQRIPVVRHIYDMAQKLVGLVSQRDEQGTRSMTPVWLHFGGQGQAAVLGLLSSPQAVMVGDAPYLAVLVPTAPVPSCSSPARAGSARPRCPRPRRSRWPTRAGACCWSAPIRRPTWTRCSARRCPTRPWPCRACRACSVLNIDPDTAAEAYRQRVLAKMAADASDDERSDGARAALGRLHHRDRRVRRIRRAAGRRKRRGRSCLRPRGLRHRAHRPHAALAEPAAAWTGFLAGNDRGASCLGPHSGLKMQEARFRPRWPP